MGDTGIDLRTAARSAEGPNGARPAGAGFIDKDKLRSLAEAPAPGDSELDAILRHADKLQGLGIEEVARLIRVQGQAQRDRILETAMRVKEAIYGRRMVFFAPLYVGNTCSNNCLYCGFRRDNKDLVRAVLGKDEIEAETRTLLREGHKRLLMLSGESATTPLDYFLEAIETAYGVREGEHHVRRINVEIAPLSVSDFARLKATTIGTYVCFQETYDPDLYSVYHPSGPKRDYLNRLLVMDRAMEGGIEDVGIGALFGLGDWRFELLGLFEHARHLEEMYGCGPHTISVPRLQPAAGSAIANHVPSPLPDEDFKLLVGVIRIAMPYTGIILSTRESEAMRNSLFTYGVSQISAGSRTNPGAYAQEAGKHSSEAGSQFTLGDHRNLDEVVSSLVDSGHIPSFCTGCYRKGRVGQDFMDLAKPGLIKEFCMPNGLFTFQEYLLDFASPETKGKGQALLDRLVEGIGRSDLRERSRAALADIKAGKRDIYF
ncbi:MAG TPA: [FeFe] hydrogenase H-cluster radical SAM maturase HydG [Rectinemataceae bacterium]|nr:[FeFe] hydrogenase H-cluster radical SAM maturase HydG [Rectinemataceae bacterium]